MANKDKEILEAARILKENCKKCGLYCSGCVFERHRKNGNNYCGISARPPERWEIDGIEYRKDETCYVFEGTSAWMPLPEPNREEESG